MPKKKIDMDVVLAIALAMPGVEESRLRGAPSLKVSGRLLACPALHKSAEPSSLVVRIGQEERAELIAADPGVYYVTDHYANHAAVLVRLDQIRRTNLRQLLDRARRAMSPNAKAGRQKPRRGRVV